MTPIDALSLTAGVRYDDHDTFGGHTTTRATAAWSVTPTTILRASYGEGFKAPTLYQLYSQYGNLNLDAEEAESWDAGIEQHFFDKRLVVSATYFDRDTTNMIDFVSCFGENLAALPGAARRLLRQLPANECQGSRADGGGST